MDVKFREKKLEKIAEDTVLGRREHYLRWKTPDTWRILEKAGPKYDTTLSFADHEGFRCGICFPYKPFDVLENRQLDIWELPLTVMDGSLFDYQNLTPEEGFRRIKNLIDTTKKYHGLFVLLWHNSCLDRLEPPGGIQVYERTMEYIGKQDIFNDTAKGIIDWWQSNVYSWCLLALTAAGHVSPAMRVTEKNDEGCLTYERFSVCLEAWLTIPVYSDSSAP